VFDIGGTIVNALTVYQLSGSPFAGSTDPYSAGNGCIMRLAPVPLFYASDPALAINQCAESSRTTHGTRACIDACRYFGGLIVGAVRGVPKDVLPSSNYSPAPGSWEEQPLCAEMAESM